MYLRLVPAFLIGCIPDLVLSRIQYTWPSWDDRWDPVVGISYNDKPVSTGIFINRIFVLTALNPLEKFVSDHYSKLKIHCIAGHPNADQQLDVTCVKRGAEREDPYWVRCGYPVYDILHSPIHDLATLSIPVAQMLTKQSWYTKKVPLRRPYPVPLVYAGNAYDPDAIFWYKRRGVSFGGFGFVDRDDIKNSTSLDLYDISEDDLVDCDDWLPRRWGYFICVNKVDEMLGIPAGAPLFIGDYLYGMGSFVLNKGRNSILVFTDLLHYVDKLRFCRP